MDFFSLKKSSAWALVVTCGLFTGPLLAGTPPPSTPPSKKSFFDYSARNIQGRKVHFSHYRGQVVLVVNTASHGGFTPQLKGLEQLYRKYGKKGFTVLAFPSNDFHREEGSREELYQFAKKEYGVSFPFFDKTSVSGEDKLEVYKFLVTQKPRFLFHEVQWNFEKFLISRQGQVLERWSSLTSPTSKSVITKIETALHDPI